ncbi:uncharacterized protein LOC122972190 isoform X3 [Thunnus albacares]|uniref:uncharacterized protein LOC122972190 isoform X3 n=1 Tax=Thunnus albacares TaxID=8236 RepID=UPI001CF672FF|nr:uncharacterized protein LOC122972190 isoform X3 [Thunnus albacares]
MILLCGGCSLAWWSSVGILACLLAANVLHCYSKLAVGVEGLLGPLGARRGRFLFPLQSNATGQLLPPIVGEAVLVPAGCRGAWLSTVHHPLNTAAALMLSPLWLFQLLFHRCCFSADSCGSAVRLTELRGAGDPGSSPLPRWWVSFALSILFAGLLCHKWFFFCCEFPCLGLIRAALVSLSPVSNPFFWFAFLCH